jgi:predicted nucleic acid-binding protein
LILDTNALSAFIDGEPALEGRLAAASQVAIPVIVLGEFRYGIAGSRHRAKYEAWLTDHLPAFEILAVTEPTTQVYTRVRTALKKAGRPIPANDAWIAALAIQHRLPVLTRDEHFDVVPGLHREGW